jgi:small subunit ribosomal protein S5
VAIGNRNGQVGVGVAKGPDVAIAIEKAVRQAKKNLIEVPIVNGTIPHWIKEKYGAAEILLRPASAGKGLMAGGVIRAIAELAGIQNITAKMLGSNNKIANARATINAFLKLKKII